MSRQRLDKPVARYYSGSLAQCLNCEMLYPPIASRSSGFWCVNCTVDAMRRNYLYQIDK